GATGNSPAGAKKPCPWAVPRLSERTRGRPNLAGGDVCGAPTGDRFVALARRAFLHQGGEMFTCDLYRGPCPTPATADDVSQLQSAAELVSFSPQSRRVTGLWLERPGADAGDGRVRGTVGEPPSRRRRNGCVRTGARRCDGGRCEPVCAGG